MMKIFKGKETSKREKEKAVSDAADAVPDSDSWFLFKFFDMNTTRWSPVYAAFSVQAAHDEMEDLLKKQPRRAFRLKALGRIVGQEFEVVSFERLYIGEQYEDIG